jgi:succinoglycan biosynthesis protein ExoA
VKISVIVATYNEERYIGRCIQGLLGQRGVDGDFEILVADGRSTDRTREIVRALPEFGDRIRLIDNPRRFQVYAWNLGLANARGEYVAIIGAAHAEYANDYLASCLEVIERTGASGVGGVQIPVGTGVVAKAVAWCMSSPFGVGNARFRYTTKEEEADSVFSIFARRQALADIGGFDERIPFDEDSELNYRLRAAGGRLIVSPSIRIRYFVRSSLRALARQMYRYGYWRRYTQLLHPGRVPLRVYAPAALVADLIACIAFAASGLRIFPLAVAGAYACFLALASAVALPKLRSGALFVPPVLVTMHVSYGAGWWAGATRTLWHGRPKPKCASS